MENLLPRFQTFAANDPPPLLSHLHWSVGASQRLHGTEASCAACPDDATSVASAAASLPRRAPHPRVLLKPAGRDRSQRQHGAQYGGRLGPSPLSLECRGQLPQEAHSHALPQLVKPVKHKPVYMSLFNGIDGRKFDVFFSACGQVHHTVLSPLSTEMRLVAGKRPTDAQDEDSEDAKICLGFCVSTVSESSLKVERSMQEGRVFTVTFQPHALGIDLGQDPTTDEVVVRALKPGGQAELAGNIKVGDRVLAIQGVILRSMADVHRMAETRDDNAGLSMEFLRPPEYAQAHDSENSHRNSLLTIWRTTVESVDKGRVLELDEDDCAMAPRTILNLHPESEVTPLAGHLAHLLATSTDDLMPITLHFCNRTRSCTLVVYWVDYSGIRRYRNTLKPGEMYLERSFASHPWLIRTIPVPSKDKEQGAGAGARTPEGCVSGKNKKAHAILLRLGPDAVRSGQAFTTVWEPGRESLSIMPFARTDVGNYLGDREAKHDTLHADPHQEVEHRVRVMRAELLQALRDNRRDDVAAACNGLVGPDGSRLASGLGYGERDRAPGLPHASVVVVDRDHRLTEALAKVRQHKQHRQQGQALTRSSSSVTR